MVCTERLQEFAPCDEELVALRNNQEWDPEKARLQAAEKVGLCLLCDEFAILSGCLAKTELFSELSRVITHDLVVCRCGVVYGKDAIGAFVKKYAFMHVSMYAYIHRCMHKCLHASIQV